MELVAEKIPQVSVLRRLLFACSYLPSSCPNYWEIISQFATEGSSCVLDPATAKLLMDNVQILNSRAFARDGELEQEIIAMKDGTHQPLGVILISPNCVCLQCGGKLLARRDRFSKVTLYTESMGTVPAKHFYKYCQKGCSFTQHYGYYSINDAQGVFYNNDWSKLQYFVSSQETAFELSMLHKFDAELLIGQLSYKQRADIYNFSKGYETSRKESFADKQKVGTSQAHSRYEVLCDITVEHNAKIERNWYLHVIHLKEVYSISASDEITGKVLSNV